MIINVKALIITLFCSFLFKFETSLQLFAFKILKFLLALWNFFETFTFFNLMSSRALKHELLVVLNMRFVDYNE